MHKHYEYITVKIKISTWKDGIMLKYLNINMEISWTFGLKDKINAYHFAYHEWKDILKFFFEIHLALRLLPRF